MDTSPAIHWWEIQCHFRLSERGNRKLWKTAKLRYGKSTVIRQNVRTINELYYHQRNFVSTNKLLEIANKLNIRPEEIEKFIIAIGKKCWAWSR